MTKTMNRLLLLAIVAMTLASPTVSAASTQVVYNSPSNPIVASPSTTPSVATTPSGSSTNWWTQKHPVTTPPASTGTPTADSTTLTTQEQLIFNNLNQARQQAGLAPLKLDPALTKLARMKAQDMVTNHYFAHTSPTYGTPDQMMRKAGLSFSAWAENIALAPDANRAYINFMTSTGHRANMMSPTLTTVGIGVVPYQVQYVSVAMEFTLPM